MSGLLRSDRDQWEPLHKRSDSSDELQMDGQLELTDDDAPGAAASSTSSDSVGGGGGGDGATDDDIGGGSDDVHGIAATARSGASMSGHHDLIIRIDQHLSSSSLAVADVSASVSGDGSDRAAQQDQPSFSTQAELLEAINRERSSVLAPLDRRKRPALI